MVKNKKLSRQVVDASFGKVISYIEWKCKCLGKYFYKVDTFYPSSKTCSICGNITDITNDLSIRNWTCPKCGNNHERDLNASINIMFEGLKLHYS